MKLEVVILAAGKGVRMRSDIPKVLHELAGRPLLGHVIARAHSLAADAIHVVYGHGGEQVPARFAKNGVNWVLQAERLGTGHALLQALPRIDDAAVVLVLYGDVPLIREATLRELVGAAAGGLALLTAELSDPAGYGRIIRDRSGGVARIVEREDAGPEELAVREINTGFMAAPAGLFKGWLNRLGNNNAQAEYYLTDVVTMAAAEGITITDRQPAAAWEIMGVNSKAQLATLERVYQNNQAQQLMEEQGVTLRDPARFDLRGELSVGRDVEIDVNVILEGKVRLGDRVRIGPNNVIRNTEIGAEVTVRENSVIENARIHDGCIIGPFARIRPGTELAGRAHVGNFVEIKNSAIGAGAKINHLSYVGDSNVGKDVNIGAGVITCNYDGARKHRTVIGDNVFIGSGTQLVAPVTVGTDATIGAGSTVTEEVPAGELTLSRTRQRTVPGWRRPTKKGTSSK